MSIKLDSKALENIKNYKYSTNGLTFLERLIMDPFWNVVVKFLPEVCCFVFDVNVEFGSKPHDVRGVNFPANTSCGTHLLRLDFQ